MTPEAAAQRASAYYDELVRLGKEEQALAMTLAFIQADSVHELSELRAFLDDPAPTKPTLTLTRPEKT
jgi:hypothetical protein